MSIGNPHPDLNFFPVESDAHAAAAEWSRNPACPEWCIVHGPSERAGLGYYVERGDGGMIRGNERLVALYKRGKKTRA
jgi:hypothetical protein